MSGSRLSAVQRVHRWKAPTGGAVHVSCPPLQARKHSYASTSIQHRHTHTHTHTFLDCPVKHQALPVSHGHSQRDSDYVLLN